MSRAYAMEEVAEMEIADEEVRRAKNMVKKKRRCIVLQGLTLKGGIARSFQSLRYESLPRCLPVSRDIDRFTIMQGLHFINVGSGRRIYGLRNTP
jgi:hypothetical protein